MATELRMLRIAASAEEEATIIQLTSSRSAVVPIVAIMVWQRVRAALIRAAFQKLSV